jgi:hypothetical protein
MPPARSIVDLSEDVFASTPHGLPHVGVTCFRDQVIATVFELKRYLIADPAVSVIDPHFRIDIFNAA